jgi:excisionase family DNA binding protein
MSRNNPQSTATTIQEPDAAQYVGLSRAYLRQARAQGHGPVFIRFGRAVRYRTADLDSWLEAHRVEPKPKGR